MFSVSALLALVFYQAGRKVLGIRSLIPIKIYSFSHLLSAGCYDRPQDTELKVSAIKKSQSTYCRVLSI